MKDIIRMTKQHLIVKIDGDNAYIDNVDDVNALIQMIDRETSMLYDKEPHTRFYNIGRHYGIQALNGRMITIVHIIGGFYTLAIEDQSRNVSLMTLSTDDVLKMRKDCLVWI